MNFMAFWKTLLDFTGRDIRFGEAHDAFRMYQDNEARERRLRFYRKLKVLEGSA